MPDALKYLIDAAVAAALFFALLLVFVVDFFWPKPTGSDIKNDLENVKVFETKTDRDGKKLKLAVTRTREEKDPFSKKITGKWDDMGKLLDELGAGYKHDLIEESDLIRLHAEQKLREFDVIFLTCNSSPDVDKLKGPLLDYVSKGGILYASDWRYDNVAAAFPDVVAEGLKGSGPAGHLDADVVDSDLREVLQNKKVPLKFDLPDWKTAAFGGPRVKVLLQGRYQKSGTNEFATAPLMVKFKVGEGTVIFTSFHNEKQNSRIEKQLLQYLVFSLVTAGIDADVNAKMEQGGFQPQRSNLLSTPEKMQTTKPAHYDNKTKGSTLRFVLGFRNEGATLRFNIKSPSGKQFAKDGHSTMVFEVTNAEAGQWTYTVTAVDLPYPNFPFTVTVGERK